MGNHEQIVAELERVYAAAEANLQKQAKELGAMHGSVMPRTYVGRAYAQTEFQGQPIPRVFVLSINQSRKGQQCLTDDEVRGSMRNILRDEEDRFRPDGFGPRALAANLCRWVFMQCGVKKDEILPQDVHHLIAYDNFVKWPFDIDRSQPPDDAWQAFYRINKAVLEVLQPQIVLCLGNKVYDHLWSAAEHDPNYRCEKNIRQWVFALYGPWGSSEVGRCYHYSNPVSPNRQWKQLRGDGKISPKFKGLLEDQMIGPDELARQMQTVDQDAQQYPWWDEETYAGPSFTQYNPYQKFAAWRVCKTVTSKWKQNRLGA